eukprot:gnl/MRDRNA2_/MRDRNA2_79337_c0_seq2.p1 gnl/MRDRNA2_/MRDRNA2_79337_c0~~gnl/MRDRNA2_/MRDRNA2_79337_c0_seq2.p1  ORF type:complete len:288 (-),score=36.93 gnl/MRDRNA2_/MRDRNA2_79337_c0_seq2:150-1013(-)
MCSCFEESHSTHSKQNIRCSVLPSHWDMSVMQGMDVVAGAGLNFNPSDGQNLYGEVKLDDQALAEMQALFDSTFRKIYTRDRKGANVPDRMELKKGIKIQNAMNWAEYCTRREAIRSQLANLREQGKECHDSVDGLKTAGEFPEGEEKYKLDVEVNEGFFFHGTNDTAAEAITTGDFRIDKAGSNAGTLYGRGIYLAESCSKSDEYSQENEKGLRCMLVNRATLGNLNYCAESRPNVDQLVDSCVTGPFHSVLGDREKIRGTYREFMVYDDDQVYPEYVLWYRRVYK